jgi:hypothetical protein
VCLLLILSNKPDLNQETHFTIVAMLLTLDLCLQTSTQGRVCLCDSERESIECNRVCVCVTDTTAHHGTIEIRNRSDKSHECL